MYNIFQKRSVYIFFLAVLFIPFDLFAGKGAHIVFTNLTPHKVFIKYHEVQSMKDKEISKSLKDGFHLSSLHTSDKKYVESNAAAVKTPKFYLKIKEGEKEVTVHISEKSFKYYISTVASKKLYILNDVVHHLKKMDYIHIYIVSSMLHDHYSKWMSDSSFVQNSTLRDIAIPGAHDAGMGKISECSKYANKHTTKTQDRSFYHMLKNGTRYFDARPMISKSGHMYLGHYTWVGKILDKVSIDNNEGCMGYTVTRVLEDVKKFLDEHKRSNEIVILNFSHFMNLKRDNSKGSNFNKDDMKELNKKIDKYLKKYLLYDKPKFLDTKIKELTKDGPKVIVIYSKSGYHGKSGKYTNGSKKIKGYMHIYDKYSNSNKFDHMKDDQFKKMKEHADSRYFLLSWTLTLSNAQIGGCTLSNMTCTSIEDLAKDIRIEPILYEVLKTKKYPNIIYTDFVDNLDTKIAIELNKIRDLQK